MCNILKIARCCLHYVMCINVMHNVYSWMDKSQFQWGSWALLMRPVMAHFHYSAELALSVPCRALPVFGCASTRPSYGAARRGATFSLLFWPDKIVVLSRPTNRAESG